MMANVSDEDLHALARSVAEKLIAPDKKQLRFNDIIIAAKIFYPRDPEAGVRELVESCDRTTPELYIKGQPMWQSLRDDYAWMADGAGE